ncbi:MAG: UDP-N-acetylmuramoyl-L-alanine--D-glutamate ligase [Spirochaetaceae bacterium]|jgi:UDP-N-acetylmuramoylalanine--D-glutamate ligase|nr:UDP-N-acetylmuramoyl-L-alanine--D-glutamate ligase [Spirochaetaceae bacterium]
MLNKNELKNSNITIMGLGLHGGGLASALFLAKAGANLTITDLRSQEVLAPTIEKLKAFPIRYVLGEHKEEDFSKADLVVKNPAVPWDSPYLKLARRVESDISIFLSFTENPVIAVTGSKGKSTIVSALFHIMKAQFPKCKLGGNITISPLSFIEELPAHAPVILELSSWQLADLKGKNLLKPEITLISNIMHDHQNRYDCFQDYIDDKLQIYQDQSPEQIALIPKEELSRGWDKIGKAKKHIFSLDQDGFDGDTLFGFRDGQGIFRNDHGQEEMLVPKKLHLPGAHIKGNILAAASMARIYGVPLDIVQTQVKNFPGVEHRMEFCRRWRGIDFYNDTAATLPDALAAAIQSFSKAPLVIFGGTDKELDISVLQGIMGKASQRIALQGSATQRMLTLLEKENLNWEGPFDNMEEALNRAVELASKDDVVILSPGATSFGMFQNEFHRGHVFKDLVSQLV